MSIYLLCCADLSRVNQKVVEGDEEQTPCISIPHKQLIGLGFFIRELCLSVQNFIFLCHSTITTFHFSSGKKKSKALY